MEMPYLGADKPILHQLKHQDQNLDPQRLGPFPLLTGDQHFQFSKPLPNPIKGTIWQLQAISRENAALSYEAYLTQADAPIFPNYQRAIEPYTWQDHIRYVKQLTELFRAHQRFSYVIVNKAGTKCLGFVQLQPIRPYLLHHGAPSSFLGGISANSGLVTYWLRHKAFQQRPTLSFLRTLHRWLLQQWEMEDHLFCTFPEMDGAAATLEAIGLQARFWLDIASTPPRQNIFYGL